MKSKKIIPLLLTALLALGTSATSARADSLDDDLAAAKKLLDAGSVDQARTKYEALKATLHDRLTKTPDDVHLLYLYGIVCMDGQDDEAAGTALDKAITLDPKNDLCLTARGTLFLYDKKPDDAIPLLQRAADQTPKATKAWTLLAEAQNEAKQFKAAEGSMRRAIALEPKDPHFLGMLAGTQLDAGHSDDALKTLHLAVEMDSKYVVGWANIGQIEQTRGHHADSLAAYRTVVQLDPDDWRAQAKIVQLYDALDKPAERDAAREKIFALWKAGKVDQDLFCRCQFTYDKSLIMVLEYFELTGPRAVRYSFNVVTPDTNEIQKRISLGSYDVTTDAARATGQIGPRDRMFHLDVYMPNGHETLAMFAKEPSFAETRKLVESYLDGKLQAAASSHLVPATQAATQAATQKKD
jgi:cytochrome c-type biogenesis protein CcmH/NrfG